MFGDGPGLTAHEEAVMAEKSQEAVRDETAQRLREIETLERMAREKGLAFASLSEDEIAKKIRGQSAGTPYIYAYEWIFKTSPGQSASFTVHVSNPDPDGYDHVFVRVFFGCDELPRRPVVCRGRSAREFQL
jgi:hypothetical protein